MLVRFLADFKIVYEKMMERSDPSPEMAIAIIVILIIEFVIGFYVQVKKIKRVKQEKNVTWELEIYHSVVCTIYFSFSIFVEIVEQLVSDTSYSTNLVLCTFSWCIKIHHIQLSCPL